MTTFQLNPYPVDTGSAFYMVFRNASGQVWNGSAFVTYTTTRDTFDVPMAEVAGTGLYLLASPTLPAGYTEWEYWKQVGGSPSHSADVRHKTGCGVSNGAGGIVEQSGDAYVAASGLSGSGADQVTVTITNEDTGLTVADASVWITSNASGTQVVGGTSQTNSSGQVTFLLDAGVTYYLWMRKDGLNPIQGQSFVAEAD